jgi:FdhD protein
MACHQPLPPRYPAFLKPVPDTGFVTAQLGVIRADGAQDLATRPIAVEAPIAIEYNGIGYAVMMATPLNLDDFAIGFSLSEGLARTPADVLEISATKAENGWILRIQLDDTLIQPVIDRARQRVTESGCGLCGLENLEQVVRPLPPITATVTASAAVLFAALANLDGQQPLNSATGAAHGAAFCAHDGSILCVREDVGRHNALDKLIGALAVQGLDPATGFFLLTARCSYELVEKTITSGCPLLVTISAPTTLAVDRAKAHNLTLVSLARRDAMLVMAGSLAS